MPVVARFCEGAAATPALPNGPGSQLFLVQTVAQRRHSRAGDAGLPHMFRNPPRTGFLLALVALGLARACHATGGVRDTIDADGDPIRSEAA